MADETPEKRDLTVHWGAPDDVGEGAWGQKRRLATAMRLVIERLVSSDAPEQELRAAAGGLERYAEALKKHPRLGHFHGFAETANAGDVGAFFDQSPLIGLANPLAPPIRVEQTGPKSARGTVTFGSAYEGPPGCVHGGFVAAAFDEVLGYAQSLSGSAGFTGTLTTRYRTPTPLHEELRFEAWVDRVEGRKIFASGTLHAGDRLCAEADAIFISIDPTRYRHLIANRHLKM